MRSDKRPSDQLRSIAITPHYLEHAEGSVLIEAGRTRVICTASVEDRVPQFLRGSGKGWVTAEYGMLPRATSTRTQREASAGKVGGRTQEIQRLIGRARRAGTTRTASITGAFVALALAFENMRQRSLINTIPLSDYVAAISVGIVERDRVDQ